MAGDVAGYYDSNTDRFLLLGRGRGVHAMHRELWGSGVTTAAGAADHINRLLGEAIDARASASPSTNVDSVSSLTSR